MGPAGAAPRRPPRLAARPAVPQATPPGGHRRHVATTSPSTASAYPSTWPAPCCARRAACCSAVWHGWRWLFDRDDAGTHELRVDAAARRDHKAYATAARIRKDRVRTRLLATVVSGGLLAVLAVIVRLAWPPGLWVLAAAAVGGLAYLGRPQNTPLIDHAVVSAAAERITPDVIVRALSNLGLAGISQALKAGPATSSSSRPASAATGPAGAPSSTCRTA